MEYELHNQLLNKLKVSCAELTKNPQMMRKQSLFCPCALWAAHFIFRWRAWTRCLDWRFSSWLARNCWLPLRWVFQRFFLKMKLFCNGLTSSNKRIIKQLELLVLKTLLLRVLDCHSCVCCSTALARTAENHCEGTKKLTIEALLCARISHPNRWIKIITARKDFAFPMITGKQIPEQLQGENFVIVSFPFCQDVSGVTEANLEDMQKKIFETVNLNKETYNVHPPVNLLNISPGLCAHKPPCFVSLTF